MSQHFPNVSVSLPDGPQAEQRPIERTLHGVRLIDDYAWLRAENWQQVMRDPSQLDPAIRAYLQTENDYCERALADTANLQEKLVAEMKGRIKEDDSSVPAPDGPYAYFTSYVIGGQHPRVCREPRAGGEATVLIDGDAMAAGKPFFSLGAAVWSHDHHHL